MSFISTMYRMDNRVNASRWLRWRETIHIRENHKASGNFMTASGLDNIRYASHTYPHPPITPSRAPWPDNHFQKRLFKIVNISIEFIQSGIIYEAGRGRWARKNGFMKAWQNCVSDNNCMLVDCLNQFRCILYLER